MSLPGGGPLGGNFLGNIQRGGGFPLASLGTNNQPPQAAAAAANPGNGGSGGQRLKVEDALSYLDQVKIQFQSRPEVYSNFLDIMKDFKSQAIDTPGVIQRVSTLFKGHPNLIVGFNTFLPMGYRIEMDPQNGDKVSISTPDGHISIISQGESVPQPPPAPVNRPPAALPIPNLAPAPIPETTPAVPTQPLPEFNHAIAYVNKIKHRFQHKPQIYKQFLEILHTYQKEQRDKAIVGQAGTKSQTESQVYDCVAKLFSDEPDLLKEFSQFLPDASQAMGSYFPGSPAPNSGPSPSLAAQSSENDNQNEKRKGEPSRASPAPKRHKHSHHQTLSYDVPITTAAKHCTLEDFQFFERLKRALRSDAVYENFLRLLILFNQELLTRSELLELAHPYLSKVPDLLGWLSRFLGCEDRRGALPEPSSDLALEIDYASCKRHGVSYRALPASYQQPKASSRTALCDEVLNDTWVSFPSWSSEDSSCVSSKKSLYEEHIYKTEDERFELDIVLHLNRSAILALEGLKRKLPALSDADAKAKAISVTEPPLLQRAIRRIYGERAGDILDGLKRNPSVALPVVLNRLKAKEEEWREAQKAFNRLWRDQNDKYYLKSLDQQSLSFKQNDTKALKGKALINQLELLYDERAEKAEATGETLVGQPHLSLAYPRPSVSYDVADLLIHHVKRQPNIVKEDKARIKRFLRVTLPDLLGLRRQELSDDEEEEEENDAENEDSGTETGGRMPSRRRAAKEPIQPSPMKERAPSQEMELEMEGKGPGYGYTLIFVPNSAYVFFRLHLVLAQRLAKLADYSESLAAAAERNGGTKKDSAAEILKAVPKPICLPTELYPTLLGAVKNLLDGALDSGQFEDNLREMFTTQAYIAFTMDKLVGTMVRQLCTMVAEKTCLSALSLYEKHRAEGGAGGPGFMSTKRAEREEAYQAAAETLLADQNCFRFCFAAETGSVSIELLDTDTPDKESEEARAEWAAYVAHFIAGSKLPVGPEEMKDFQETMADKPIFLFKHVRSRTWSGSSSSHLVHEGLEMSWSPTRQKAQFVTGTSDVFMRRGARKSALESCGSVTQKERTKRMAAVIQAWLEKNCSGEEESKCEEWLKEGAETSEGIPSIIPSKEEFSELRATHYSSRPSSS